MAPQEIDNGSTILARDWNAEEYKALISYVRFVADTGSKTRAMQKTIYSVRDRIPARSTSSSRSTASCTCWK